MYKLHENLNSSISVQVQSIVYVPMVATAPSIALLKGVTFRFPKPDSATRLLTFSTYENIHSFK
jgi:hypothetical protein